MTDRLFTDTGTMKEGITVLANDKLRGLRGVYVGTRRRDGRIRIEVKITDVGNSSFHEGAHIADWEENWREDK